VRPLPLPPPPYAQSIIRSRIRTHNEPFLRTNLVEVWRQALVENANFVELGKARYPVRKTPKRGLRQVDFVFDANEIRGLEQNPDTKSRWAQMARSGKKVMQFLSEDRYFWRTWLTAGSLYTAGERGRVDEQWR